MLPIPNSGMKINRPRYRDVNSYRRFRYPHLLVAQKQVKVCLHVTFLSLCLLLFLLSPEKCIESVRYTFLPPANEVCEGYVFTGVCLSTGEGHVWLLVGGMPGCWWGACMVAGRGACVVAGWGACMVAGGGPAWLLAGEWGACVVAGRGTCMVAGGGHAWLLVGGHVWLLAGEVGVCMVAGEGVCMVAGWHAWLLGGGAV